MIPKKPITEFLTDMGVTAVMPLDGWVRSLEKGVGKKKATQLRITATYPQILSYPSFSPGSLVALQTGSYIRPTFRIVRVVEKKSIHSLPHIADSYHAEAEPYQFHFGIDGEFEGTLIDSTRLEVPEPEFLPLWLCVGKVVCRWWDRVKEYIPK